MDLIEKVVLYKLRDFKEKANRDRFILPIDKNIDLFIDIMNETIKMLIKND